MSSPTRSGTAGPPHEPPTSGDLIATSLAAGRQSSARFMNGLRALFTSLFVLVYVFVRFGLEDEGLRATAPHLLLYWLAALALWFLGSRSRGMLALCRFAVPLLDIPVVTWIQLVNIRGNPSPDAAAVFTLALFVFLTAMSSFSLRARHLIPTALAGAVAILIVYREAGLSMISLITGPLLILMTAVMMSWLPRRQNALIREAALRESRRGRLARYFSPGVAELIEARDHPEEGESCEISVLFCDIRGFTRLSENLPASEVVRLLNDFHGHMVDEIFRHGGTLDKYLGDGLLAWFNAPVPQPDHATRAVRCALSMLESLERLNLARQATGAEPLRVGIGIHAGTAIVGNIGASHRREFTAIGDTVNVASRLQSLTRDLDTDILVSEAVRELVASAPEIAADFTLAPAGEAPVRGRVQPVALYIPTAAGLTPEYPEPRRGGLPPR